MGKSRLLMLGAVVAVIAGCGSGGTSASTAGWRTYTSSDEFSLTFRYPGQWSLSAKTIDSSMGHVGAVLVAGQTNRQADAFWDSGSCHRSDALLGRTGVLVEWSAQVGQVQGPEHLVGSPVTVSGGPSAVQSGRGRPCGVPVQFVDGTIQVRRGDYLYMHATLGADADAATRDTVLRLFRTAGP